MAQLSKYHACANDRFAAPRPAPHRRGGPKVANINDIKDYYGAFDERCYAVRAVPTEEELHGSYTDTLGACFLSGHADKDLTKTWTKKAVHRSWPQIKTLHATMAGRSSKAPV